jgi:uncharacterized protein YbaR (Trm112 family)
MIDESLLEIIVCPKCKSNLKYDKGKSVLICENCKVFYPIEDEIPVLLEEEAKPLNENEK